MSNPILVILHSMVSVERLRNWLECRKESAACCRLLIDLIMMISLVRDRCDKKQEDIMKDPRFTDRYPECRPVVSATGSPREQ